MTGCRRVHTSTDGATRGRAASAVGVVFGMVGNGGPVVRNSSTGAASTSADTSGGILADSTLLSVGNTLVVMTVGANLVLPAKTSLPAKACLSAKASLSATLWVVGVVTVLLSAGQVGGATSSITSNIAGLNWARAALELIPPDMSLAVEVAALPPELIDCDRREGSSAVELRLNVMHLVHTLGAVHNVGLDHILLNDGLDMLVDVVMNMLTLGGSSLSLCAGG